MAETIRTPQFILIADSSGSTHVINIEQVVQLSTTDSETLAGIELTNGKTIFIDRGDATGSVTKLLMAYSKPVAS